MCGVVCGRRGLVVGECASRDVVCRLSMSLCRRYCVSAEETILFVKLRQLLLSHFG